MDNKLILTPNTIVLTIGISNCGKSYFCENHLLPFLKSHPNNITAQYLSSDKIRRDLLGNSDTHKHAEEMMFVSKQAFNILHNLLDNYSQYPVNNSVIVVDATNISGTGRKQIFDLAKKNNYSVVGLLFDYKDTADYFKHCDPDNSKSKYIIKEHLKYFKERTLPELEKREFKKIYKITDQNFNQYNFVYEESNIEKFDTSIYERYCIIGDAHGCFDEVLQCVLDNKGLVYNKETGLLDIEDPLKYVHHILLGDYLDKGPQIKELLKFLYDNKHLFTFVKGNHENYVYKFLKGQLGSYEKEKEVIDNYFDSCLLLQNDEEYKKMFFELFENSYNYIKGSNFIATHAPCSIKYLGKDDSESIKHQRTIRYPKHKDFSSEEEYLNAFENCFSFLNEDAEFNHAFHFFGHVALTESYTYKNKYGLDTGCVYGNKLTTASINTNSKKPFIKSYHSKQPNTWKGKLHTMFRVKTDNYSIASLDIEIQKRLKWAAKNQLNFISGTMSPVDKLIDHDTNTTDLESLELGIKYFYDKKVNKLILQPKYMGSRANILLHASDPIKSKVFSRQGFEIDNQRLTLSSDKTIVDVLKELQNKHKSLFEKYSAEFILLDGELLPWKAMGKKMIEKEFLIPQIGTTTEINLLKETSFEVELKKLEVKMNELSSKIENDPTYLETLPLTIQSQFKTWIKFKDEIEPIANSEDNLKKYTRQMEIFANDGELEFKPFSILKIIRKDGSEENFLSSTKSNIEIFKELNNENNVLEPYCEIDFEKKRIHIHYTPSGQGLTGRDHIADISDFSEYLKYVQIFWKYITNSNDMEGIVIKPNQVYIPNVAPYLKCRNKEYLRIIYGMDYDSLPIKKAKLLKNKSIEYKLKTSIKEWELGKKLLNIPMKDISIDNKEWVYLCVQLFKEQENEINLDPRL